GVQRGIQTSQIIATARSTSQPLTDDVRNMNVFESRFGGNNPGFLVIAQRSFGGVLYPAPDDITDDTSFWGVDRDGDGNFNENTGANNFDDLMRSDQIGFFRNANKLESLTPGENSRYDSDASARHAFIWYGHVWPADVNPAGGVNNDRPGDANYNLSSQMALGRQATLLIENDAATVFPGGLRGDGSGAGVQGRVGDAGSSLGDLSGNRYLGYNDTLGLNSFERLGETYSVYDDTGVDPPTGAPRALFRTPTYDVSAPANPSWFGSAVGAGGLPNLTYANRALEWMYLTPGERLRAATFVDNDFSFGIFRADTIAQLHSSFAPHVADFAIEIAADWVDDWDEINGTPGQDGQPDYEPDRDDAGNIVWYTLIRPNPDGSNLSTGLPNGDGTYDGIGQVRPREPVTYDASAVTLAAFDGTAGSTLVGNPFIYVNNFVFAHTGDNLATDEVTDPPAGLIEGSGKYWPYLIRFRYRLMDGKGEFRTLETDPITGEEFTVVGRWFEQVVPVPRPQGLY
ncbi:MAG: hypothetical protein AAF593_13580, partial [Planctomycetota bacterium]